MAVKADKRDREMMLKQDYWPAWPFLPIKRNNHSLEDKNLGVLLATKEHAQACKGSGPFVVYHVYMFVPPKTRAEWDAAPKTEYPDIEALVADGWVVD